MVGLGRLELPTSPLSGVCSNQLSYRPIVSLIHYHTICVNTRKAEAFIKTFYFKIRR